MFPEPQNEEERLSKENLRLKSAVEELSILNDIATAIASTQSLDQITKLIVKKCVKNLKYNIDLNYDWSNHIPL
jgi:hypothetical protein